MQASNVPASFPIPFAYAAAGSYIRTVPTTSQIGIVAGAASLTDGFPPLTFSPVASGGAYASGQDWNGILYRITNSIQWIQAGQTQAFNALFATQIGGYPKGCVLGNAANTGQWLNNADNNLTNPDAPSTSFSGYISGTTLYVTTMIGSNAVTIGQLLSGTGVSANTQILSQTSGTTGGVGQYVVQTSQTISPGTITAAGAANWTLYGGLFSSVSTAATSTGTLSVTGGEITFPGTGNITGNSAYYGMTFAPSANGTNYNFLFTNAAGAGLMWIGLTGAVTLSGILTANAGINTTGTVNAGSLSVSGGGSFGNTVYMTTLSVSGGGSFGTAAYAPTASIGTTGTQIATCGFVTPSLGFAFNGYIETASGIMYQWGGTTTNNSSDTVVSFPIAYPNNVMQIVATAISGGSGNCTYYTTSRYGFNTNCWTGGGVRTSLSVSWWSVGY